MPTAEVHPDYLWLEDGTLKESLRVIYRGVRPPYRSGKYRRYLWYYRGFQNGMHTWEAWYELDV